MLNIQTCNGGINLKNIFLEIIFFMSLCPFNSDIYQFFYMSFSNVYVLLWLCYAFAEGAFVEGAQWAQIRRTLEIE